MQELKCNVILILFKISYHNAYDYVPNPTIFGHNLNNNLMTMLAKVPLQGVSRIRTFDSDAFDTRNEYEFTHKAGTGPGNFSFTEGSLVVNQHVV